MSPGLNGSTALQRFECGIMVEICNRIMFNFYPELPHIAYHDKMIATAKVRRQYSGKHREGMCRCSQEKVWIARAAVNESVCEDSHTEHV